MMQRRLLCFLSVVIALAAAVSACAAQGDLDLGPRSDDDASARLDAGADASGSDDAPGPASLLCGNKKIDSGEQCDDGNTISGDGCSSTCTLESAGPADLCAGVPIALTSEDASTLFRAHLVGTTTGLYNHYAASCGGGSGADAVYQINPPMTGRATVRISAGYAAIVSARSQCADAKSELACADDSALGSAGSGSGSTIAFPVFQGAPVFLLVDGYGGASGDFTLDIDVQTAVCGNGHAEYPEGCDDGNVTSGDGCSQTCVLEDTSTTTSVCPGLGYRLGSSGAVSFAGDTAALANGGGSATGCASSGAGPNAIYAITPTNSGNLSLSLLAAYPDALLHVRRECTENESQADCVGSSANDGALVPLKTNLPVTAEQTVYIFVDSASSSDKGLYTLDVKLAAAACGNGALDSNEECDDGNPTNGDGCSSLCLVERDPSTYTCPGKSLRLEKPGAAAGPRSLSVRGGTTAPLASDPTVPASKWKTCGSDKAPDVVYQVTSDIDGWLTAKVKGAAFNTTIAVRDACLGTAADLACAKSVGGNGEEMVSVAMKKETSYFVIVDGAGTGQLGAFALDLTVTPSVCGNSIIEGGETCDDGAIANSDGCDVSCKLEPPSPHDDCATAPLTTLEPRAAGAFGATITSGNTNLTKAGSPSSHSMSPCSSLWSDGWFPFTPPISGVMTARISSATFRSTIGVRTGCSPAGAQLVCDGADAKGGQEITFSADQGVTYWIGIAGGFVTSGTPEIGRFTLDMNLVPKGCGDTFVNAPEACDDGNLVNGDGCSSTCTVESLANVQSCPGHAVALAGSGTEVRRAIVTIDTTTLPSNTGSICGGSGPEGVLVITPDVDGQLAIKSTASHAVIVHARTACGDPSTEIPKSSCGSSTLGSVNAPVKKGVPYYIFVDGQNGAAGVTKLQITVTP